MTRSDDNPVTLKSIADKVGTQGGAACRNCGSVKTQQTVCGFDVNYLTSREPFFILHCFECGLDFTAPELSEPELAAAYPSSYRVWSESLRWMGRNRNRLSRFVALASGSLSYTELFYPALLRPEKFGPPGRMLEVGCGSGASLSIFRAAGWEVVGIEPSEVAARQALDRGLNVIKGSLEQVELPLGHFDTVVMHHVIEHLRILGPNLDKLSASLADRGRIYIGLPNFGTAPRKFFGPAWSLLDLPRHRFHFTPESLRNLLCKHGLEVVEERFLVNVDAVLQSLVNLYLHRRLTRSPATFAPGLAIQTRTALSDFVAPVVSTIFGRALPARIGSNATSFCVIAVKIEKG